MQDEYQLRTFEGKGILRDHLKKIEEAAGLFLSALKGFRRDLAISMQAHPKYIKAQFLTDASELGVPPLRLGGDFALLSRTLGLAEQTADGTLKISFPWAANQAEYKKIAEEMDLIHQNLMRVSDTAHQLSTLIQGACLEYDMFNGKNVDVGYTEANILFDRDALNVAMTTARAISERAVRFDIDLVGKMNDAS